MRVVVLTVGSRGDIQPYAALAAGLVRAGHEVLLATHEPFRPLVESTGARFAPLPGDPREVLDSEEARRLLATGHSLVRFARRFVSLLEPWWWDLVESLEPITRRAEMIVYSPLAFAGWHLGQARGIPTALATLQPFARTREFPPVALDLHLGAVGNLLGHRLAEQLFWQPLRRPVNEWRTRNLGLSPMPWSGPFAELERTREPQLFGYSPTVLPPPPDWGDWHHVTGYWYLDHPDWLVPRPLEDFLAAGPPPVYAGFGSMAAGDPVRITEIVLAACRAAGTRAVLSTGWGGLHGVASDDVFALEEAPHDRLFPHMSAAIHHGGAGTAGAAFRAGIPQVVVPFFADQPFWGRRVARLGCGPDPIPRRELSVDRLATGLRLALQRDAPRRQAAELGWMIAQEDGVARGVDLVEQTGTRHLR